MVAVASGSGARLIHSAVRRPLALLLAAFALSLLFAYGAQRVQTDTSVGLLVDQSSADYRDQAAFADAFGADPIVLMVEAKPGSQLLTPDHMVGLAALEGRLASAPGVKRVYGPGTLVNTFATEVTKRALDLCGTEGKAAEAAVVAGKSGTEATTAGQTAFDAAVRACAQRLAAQYPTLGAPALNNPTFYNEVLLEPGGKQARPFWAWALPAPNYAVISVRMDRRATAADVTSVLDRIDAGQGRTKMAGLAFSTAGAPALSASLADSVERALLYLLPLTLVIMLGLTYFLIRVPLRLLAVPLAALAGLWTYGAAGLAGLPLTPATLAVLPVVLGLTTDYTLQAANRLAEETGSPEERLRHTVRAILPATAVAAVATAAGVLAFLLSPIPLVQQFALFLAIGVAASYLVSVLVGVPLLAIGLRPGLRARLRLRDFARPAPSWDRLVMAGRLPRNAVIAIIGVGLLGWAALPVLKVETDPGKLLPAGSATLAAAEHIRQSIGLVGELDLVLTGKGTDVTSEQAVGWMRTASQKAVAAAGGDLRPLSSLPEFLLAFNNGQAPDAKTTEAILTRIPAYFTGAVVSADHHLARSVFGLPRLTSVDDDRTLIKEMTGGQAPPAGFRAYAAGLGAVAAQALTRLQALQLWLNLLALALVLLVLGIAYLNPVAAVLAVLPTAVAAGWATGLMFLSGVHASPITVLLAGVVVAFATEFSVLWLSRYRSELKAGLEPLAASELASRRVGPAVVASSAALVAGFLVLALPFAGIPPLVRDFGLWSGVDMAIATVSVLVLLPPLARSWLR